MAEVKHSEIVSNSGQQNFKQQQNDDTVIDLTDDMGEGCKDTKERVADLQFVRASFDSFSSCWPSMKQFFDKIHIQKPTLVCKKITPDDARVVWKGYIVNNTPTQAIATTKKPNVAPEIQNQQHQTSVIIKMTLVDSNRKQSYIDEWREIYAMEWLEPLIKHQVIPGSVLLYRYFTGPMYEPYFAELTKLKRDVWPWKSKQIAVVSVQEAANVHSLQDLIKKSVKQNSIMSTMDVLSCTYQTFANYLGISFYTGLAHNDMYARNIFYKKMRKSTVLKYTWPDEGKNRHVRVSTNGMLWLIGDWGNVTCEEWDKESHLLGANERTLDLKHDRNQWGHWDHVWSYRNLGPIRRDWLAYLSSWVCTDRSCSPIESGLRQWFEYILHQLLDMSDADLVQHATMAKHLHRWFSPEVLSTFRLPCILQWDELSIKSNAQSTGGNVHPNPTCVPSTPPSSSRSKQKTVIEYDILNQHYRSLWLKLYKPLFDEHQKQFIDESIAFYNTYYSGNSQQIQPVFTPPSDKKVTAPSRIHNSENHVINMDM